MSLSYFWIFVFLLAAGMPVVFALLIGVLVLNERLDLAKVASTLIALAGAGLMRLAKG